MLNKILWDDLDNFSFSKVKVLIVGDIMIDRYWWGTVERISPEAPVPVVKLNKTTVVLGGAANVAANIAGLGATAILIGAAGDDEESKLFPELLKNSGISPEFLVQIKNCAATMKTRVIAHSQQVTRIDQETGLSLNKNQEEKIWRVFQENLKNADTVVFSDYAKGVLSESLTKRLIETAKKENKFILVDPKGRNFQKYKGADLLTPNRKEIAELLDFEISSEKSLEKAGQKVISDLQLRALLITLGEKGMSLFRSGEKTLNLSASAREVYDVTGAGDTVIAVLAAALGAGLSLEKSAELANTAAGIVVEQVGTTAIKLEDLRQTVTRQVV